jgi:hypothetical protein
VRIPTLLLVAVIGCNEPAATAPGGPASSPPPPPRTTLAVEATYLRTGSWDLSAPLDVEPELGDRVADLTVDVIVDYIGPPDFLDGLARDAFDLLLHEIIASYANDLFPAELTPSGQFRDNLKEALSDIQVEGYFELVAKDYDPNLFAGGGELTRVALRYNDDLVEIAPADLNREDIAPANASVLGHPGSVIVVDQTTAVLSLSTQISYGALVRAAAKELLGVEDVQSYVEELAATFDCEALSQAITADAEPILDAVAGDDSLLAAYLDQVAEVIVAGCVDLRGGVEETILPALHRNSQLHELGRGQLRDKDNDGVVDQIVVESHPLRFWGNEYRDGGSYQFPAAATVARKVADP